MEASQPPQVVVEELGPCRDRNAILAELDLALRSSHTPTGPWQVRARFAADKTRIVAHGDVLDAAGTTVASRALTGSGSECASLAKGLGLWASLVLDAEVDREAAAKTPIPDDPLSGPPAARSALPWPDPSPDLPRPPEADWYLRHPRDERTVELGGEMFLMGGTGGGAILGPAIYGVFEAAHGFFLRPSLLVGHSVGSLASSGQAAATFLASRFDACARLAGMYLEHRGIQLDVCGGVDLGFSRLDDGVVLAASSSNASRTLPFLSLGPSFGLRGELGNNLSVTLRGVTELSLFRDDLTLGNGAHVDPSAFAGRAEVGLSWSLR